MLNDSKPETLLDDIDLINTLESSKLTSEEIKLKIDESVILEQVIESTRNQYKSVSIRGSILEKSHLSAFIAIRDSLLGAISRIITNATPKQSSIIAISPGVKLASIGTIC